MLAEGVERAVINDMIVGDTFNFAEVTRLQEDTTADSGEVTVLTRIVKELFEKYARTSGRFSPETAHSIMDVTSPDKLADIMASNILTELEERQEILETHILEERLEKLCRRLKKECELAEVESRVQARLKTTLEKSQKEYYLREQIRAIQEELGDTDTAEIDELRKKAQSLPLNDEAREKVEKELNKLSHMAPGSPDITVSRSWIDWVLDMPWGKYTRDDLDLDRARRVLNEDHYAMDKVKERVIEYLAVLAMKKLSSGDDSMRGSVLCFVGPPGVGKTSIVKGIARALGRKFVQMSLGGVRDEAEIRGHRRTYVGAIPGRILSGMKQAGTMNPVFLFDEIDKMSSDYKGDPSSAML